MIDRDQALRVTAAVKTAELAEVRGAHHHLVRDDPPQIVSIVERWLG